MRVSELLERDCGLPVWDVTIEYGPTGNDKHGIKVNAASKKEAVTRAEEWAEKNKVRSPMINSPVKITETNINSLIKTLAESFLFEEDPIPTPVDGNPTTPPVTPPGGTTPAPGSPHDDYRNQNIAAGLWFRTFASQLAWLYSATRISARLKQLGIKGEGARRVKNAINIAKQNVSLLLANPGWRDAPRYEFVNASKGTAAKINKQVTGILTKELSKIPKNKFYN